MTIDSKCHTHDDSWQLSVGCSRLKKINKIYSSWKSPTNGNLNSFSSARKIETKWEKKISETMQQLERHRLSFCRRWAVATSATNIFTSNFSVCKLNTLQRSTHTVRKLQFVVYNVCPKSYIKPIASARLHFWLSICILQNLYNRRCFANASTE